MSLPIAGQILRERLEALSEIDLQRFVVEPLLEKNGFESVRDVSGPNEKGRDLVAVKAELGTSHFYAVQVKKLKISGRVEDPQSLMGLLYQLDQAIHEEAFDPASLSKRSPDRLIFITPHTINRAALDAALEKYRSLSRNQVTIIDGTTLASEVVRLIPEVAAAFSDDAGYRLRLTSEHNVIAESKSFGLSTPLTLPEIFVEADYTCFDNLQVLLRDFLKVEEIPKEKGARPPIMRPACSKEELEFLARCETRWLETPRPSTRQPGDYTLNQFMRSLVDHINSLTESISKFRSTDSDEVLDKIHKGIAALQAGVADICKTVILQQRSHLLSDNDRLIVADAYEMLTQKHRLLTYRHLYRSGSVIAITGIAGAGKSTLLNKLLTKALEEDSRRVPVFGRAIDIEQSSVEGVLSHLLTQWNRGGVHLSPKDFKAKVSEGSVRIMIDGLDEAGERAQKLANAIGNLTQTFPMCPVTVTARETVDLSGWHSAIHVKLCPFTDHQMNDFIQRWFAAKPTACVGLQRWLEEHPAMREIARTPLVAALMCSLYDAGEAAMPLSEAELYGRRLDFLLGRWELAKAIAPMPDKARLRYMLFLMHLAHNAHERQIRSFEYVRALELTARFMTRGFNPNGESVIHDCLGRGLLERDLNGALSLGHLVHQEFLAGRYMHQYNNPDVIASRLGVDWWRRPLYFYASLIGDISTLLRRLSPDQRKEHSWQLQELIQAAGETPDRVL